MTIGKIIGLSGALLGLAGAVPAGIDQRVLVVDTAGAPATLGGGTQYADGGTQANPTGNVSLWLDTSNVLRAASAAKPFPVNVVAGSGSGVSVTDSAAWTAATSVFVPGGGVFNDSAAALTAGQQGTQRLTAARGAHSNLRTTAGGDPLLTNNNAAPAALSNLGVAGAVASTAVPSWTDGNQVLLSTNLSGAMRSAAEGPTANGSAVTRPPVMVGGQFGGNVKILGLDTNGGITQGAPNAAGTSSWPVQGQVAAGAAVAGNPVLQGVSDGANSQIARSVTGAQGTTGTALTGVGPLHQSVVLGSNPTAVTAGQFAYPPATRGGIPFEIGGHPNVVTVRANFSAAQTDTALVTVAAGTKIVVTSLMVTASNADTVNPSVIIGFGTANTPTTTGVVGSHPGIAPGSGFGKGNGAGIIGIGADDEDLRITSSVATGGSLDIVVSYFTSPS